MRVIIVGAGTLGGRVGARLAADGHEVHALTATPHRHAALAAQGMLPSTQPASTLLQPGDHVLLCLPGSQAQAEAARSLATAPTPARVVLASSTAYYGEQAGHVTPSTPPGEGARTEACVAAEHAASALGASVIVRLGGLYERGRGPVQPYRRSGEAPVGPPDRTLALIHYDDAATALYAALLHPSPQPCYHAVSDPLPSRQAFYEAASALHGLPAPRFSEPLGPPARSYALTALRRDLLPEPAWPDWHAALQ